MKAEWKYIRLKDLFVAYKTLYQIRNNIWDSKVDMTRASFLSGTLKEVMDEMVKFRIGEGLKCGFNLLSAYVNSLESSNFEIGIDGLDLSLDYTSSAYLYGLLGRIGKGKHFKKYQNFKHYFIGEDEFAESRVWLTVQKGVVKLHYSSESYGESSALMDDKTRIALCKFLKWLLPQWKEMLGLK